MLQIIHIPVVLIQAYLQTYK